jgi:signal transduction histidine kinase
MEELVHVVAHDLRSPMTSMYGFMHVALDEVRGLTETLEEEGRGERVVEPLEEGIRSVEKLNRMVQRLLDFSRAARATYSFERVDLDALVKGVVASLRYQIEGKKVAVDVGRLPEVSADPVQLEAVFTNLIDNAVKYMGNPVSPGITVACMTSDGDVVYRVSDNGIGMTADEVSKAFMPFRRFHVEAAPGEGIGLPHIRKIIERHGGRIWCESRKGEGSTFYFTLGASSQPAFVANEGSPVRSGEQRRL